MAARNFDSLKILGSNRVEISGSFRPNGSSAISATHNHGKGWSVAYTTTGVYTITLADTYAALDSAIATLQLASADDKFVNVGPVDLTARTVIIYAWDIGGAGAADVASNANNKINFSLVLRNSSIDN